MELPAALRSAIDTLLERESLGDIKSAAGLLSGRYRAETRDGRLHLRDASAVRAYLATRMPATYAAIRASLDAIATSAPDFLPASLLDVGAGPGTVLWAAKDCWPDLARATMVEASDAVRETGTALAKNLPAIEADWLAGDISGGAPPPARPADLVTLAYVLDELPPASIAPLIDRLWALTADTLLVVEPGTPAGWRRILAVRARLIDAGAHLLAPCPHAQNCPIAEPDWCHFSRRVARSRIHRLGKGADVPWEDEKFSYVAASRNPALPYEARVLSRPRPGSGRVQLKLCLATGAVDQRLLTRRDGEAFRAARRADWGDAL